MILSFGNEATEDIFLQRDTRAARRVCPPTLWRVARRKLELVNRADELDDLRVPPGNRLKRLQGNRLGAYGIRINDQYRVCFRWSDRDAEQVEIVDYH